MFPFAESARAHVSFAGAHHNGYTQHSSHMKISASGIIIISLKKEKTRYILGNRTHTHKSRMKSVRSSVFFFFKAGRLYVFFRATGQVIELTCTHTHTVRHVIIIFFFFWVCVVTFFAFFYRVLRPSFFFFLCRVAAGAPCPAVTSSFFFFFFFQAIKVSFFLFPIIFHSPQKLKNPLRISSKKDKKQKKKKEEEAIFLFISLSADGRVWTFGSHTRDPASPSHFLSSKEDAQMSSPPLSSILSHLNRIDDDMHKTTFDEHTSPLSQ